MPRALRVVRTGDAPGAETATMQEALTDQAARIGAIGPSVVLTIYELPDGSGEIELSPLPGSIALAKGLALSAYRKLFPGVLEEDD